jgi:hypothetical protein
MTRHYQKKNSVSEAKNTKIQTIGKAYRAEVNRFKGDPKHGKGHSWIK